MSNNNEEKGRRYSWDTVALRLKELGRYFATKEGKNKSPKFHCAIVTIRVIVDENGKPIGWESPTYSRLEPSGSWIEDVRLCSSLESPLFQPTNTINRDLGGNDG